MFGVSTASRELGTDPVALGVHQRCIGKRRRQEVFPLSRYSNLVRRLGNDGPRGFAQRLARRAYRQLDAGELDFSLLPGDLADSVSLGSRTPAPVRDDRPLRVGWLTTPPGAGSGGHTTMFRMVRSLETAGLVCVIVLYDRHDGDVAQQAAVIRRAWPWVRAEVRSVEQGLGDLDAVVATAWPTAHVLARRSAYGGVRLYFVQDYEPFFFPRGSEYELAADTYRFGFINIALGHMVQDRLRSELCVASELVPFSCDTEVYGLLDAGPRSGVVFYAKPEVARRGYRLGALALAEFHRRHPEHEIHLYGDPVSEIAFPVTRHGSMSPTELNALYNRTIGGLAMSFTNISLVAEEMLAAGCLPVVNDSPDARADLPNPHVVWATATPSGLADALSRIVESHDPEVARTAAASVRTDNWRDAGEGVVQIVRSALTARR